MAYDFFRRRIIHPVYVIGLVSLGVLRLRGPLRESEEWLSISGWLAKFFM